MLSSKELFDQTILAIDLLGETLDQDDYIVINKNDIDTKEKISNKILKLILERLQNEEQIIFICDERKTSENKKSFTNFFIKILDARYIGGWVQDIRDRQKSSISLVEKFDDSLVNPNYEQALEIFENKGQVFITGSLLHGYSFNIFQTDNTQRIKRIMLSLIRVSEDFNKTLFRNYNQAGLKPYYGDSAEKYFDKDMEKSNFLSKDINQETIELFNIIYKYLIDVNGRNYSFCRAFSRTQFINLSDDKKSIILKEVNRYLWKRSQDNNI